MAQMAGLQERTKTVVNGTSESKPKWRVAENDT